MIDSNPLIEGAKEGFKIAWPFFLAAGIFGIIAIWSFISSIHLLYKYLKKKELEEKSKDQ